jgi:hypothetical protein
MELDERRALRDYTQNLMHYGKAYGRYVRAYPSPQIAEAHFDNACRDVLTAFDDELVRTLLDENIRASSEQVQFISPDADLVDLTLIRRELTLANEIGLSKNEAIKIIGKVPRGAALEIPTDAGPFKISFQENHRHALDEISQTRGASPLSGTKRSRRRTVELATFSTIVAMGMIATNLPHWLVAGDATYNFSLGSAMSILNQVIRDIITV